MIGWKVLLSNGEEHCEDRGNHGSWRTLCEYCKSNDLTIKKFWFNDQQKTLAADEFFMIFNIMALVTPPVSIHRQGFGRIRRSAQKVYIEWHDLAGKFLFKEVQQGIPDFLSEISILYEK
jgi:hypothetical protein